MLKAKAKRAVGMLLSMVMIASLFTMPASGVSTMSSWAADEVNKAIEENIVQSGILSDYQKQITLEEAAALAVKLCEKLSGKPAQTVKTNSSTAKTIVTREQLAGILVQMLYKLNPEIVPQDMKTDAVQEGSPATSAYNQKSVDFLVAQKLLLGTNGGIKPLDAATREQAIALAYRLYTTFGFDTWSGEVAQLTTSPNGHCLTTKNVFSYDSKWVVYDTRKESSSSESATIERVNVETKEVQVLYHNRNGEKFCGIATYHPFEDKVIFVRGPENPTDDFKYFKTKRMGTIVDCSKPDKPINVESRDTVSPYTAGALRGGTHVHVFSPDGTMVSETYDDEVAAQYGDGTDGKNAAGVSGEANSRTISVNMLLDPKNFSTPLAVPAGPRNVTGSSFSVIAVDTNLKAAPGSNDAVKAEQETWIGNNGYIKADGTRQKKAIAFQGKVVGKDGKQYSEIFVVDLPEDLTKPAVDAPLQGTLTTRMNAPAGTVQRRLTFTSEDKYPGANQPRFSSYDGSRIYFKKADANGITQIWYVSPNGGDVHQVTNNATSVESDFGLSYDDKYLTYITDKSLFITETATGKTKRLTVKDNVNDIESGCCIISPDGRNVVYAKRMYKDASDKKVFDIQLFLFTFNRLLP